MVDFYNLVEYPQRWSWGLLVSCLCPKLPSTLCTEVVFNTRLAHLHPPQLTSPLACFLFPTAWVAALFTTEWRQHWSGLLLLLCVMALVRLPGHLHFCDQEGSFLGRHRTGPHHDHGGFPSRDRSKAAPESSFFFFLNPFLPGEGDGRQTQCWGSPFNGPLRWLD